MKSMRLVNMYFLKDRDEKQAEMFYPAEQSQEKTKQKTMQALKNKNYDRGEKGNAKRRHALSEIKHKTWQIIELEQTTTLQR